MKKLFFCLAILFYSCAKVQGPVITEFPVEDKIYDTIPIPIPRDTSNFKMEE